MLTLEEEVLQGRCRPQSPAHQGLEDEPCRVQIKLALESSFPLGEHVLPVLLGGVSLFERVVLAPEEALQRADPSRHPLFLAKASLHLLQRNVAPGLHQPQQVVALGFQLGALRLAVPPTAAATSSRQLGEPARGGDPPWQGREPRCPALPPRPRGARRADIPFAAASSTRSRRSWLYARAIRLSVAAAGRNHCSAATEIPSRVGVSQRCSNRRDNARSASGADP